MIKTIFNIFLILSFIISLIINLNQFIDIKFGFNSLIVFFIIICIVIILSLSEPNYIKLVYKELIEPEDTSYIDGEQESFAALTKVTSKAKDIIRATRFFPISVLTAQNYIQTMENRILGADGKNPLTEYHRIVAVNNLQKQQDIIHHLNRFSEKPFKLYLTTHQNDFELVIIDETDAFICFYKEKRVVASCLHVRGKMVVREIIELFDNLKRKEIIEEFDCSKIKSVDIPQQLEKVKNIFNEHCVCTSSNTK